MLVFEGLFAKALCFGRQQTCIHIAELHINRIVRERCEHDCDGFLVGWNAISIPAPAGREAEAYRAYCKRRATKPAWTGQCSRACYAATALRGPT